MQHFVFRFVPRLDRFFRAETFLFFLWLFLLVFPKGGVKIGGLPITWGYLLLGLGSLYAISQKAWQIRMPRLEALLFLVPFQMISAISILINEATSVGWTISFFVAFFFLPIFFLFLVSKKIEEIELDFLFCMIRQGVAIVSYYGIFLFFYKFFIGNFLEIPLLTVNLGDLGALDDYKCNSRGLVSKLISTYNNGQLFGISMILLLPLYCYIQKNPWHRWVAKAALFLTLSRTTWIGLIANEILFFLFVEKNKKMGFLKVFCFLCFLVCGFFCLYSFFGYGFHFYFDSTLGGRKAQLEILRDFSWFSGKPFSEFPEMVYLGILNVFGLMGLVSYLVAMGGPIFMHFRRKCSKIRTCVALGMFNYLFISLSDGAVLYIPILAFYWFLASLLARESFCITEAAN